LEERLRDPVFRVSGLGLPDAGIAELCMRVAQGDRGRIVENGDDIQGEAVAIISDFFDDATRVLEVIEKIHQRGARRIAVVSLAGEFPTRGVESLDARLSYMNLPRAVYQSEACPYCTQGVAVVPVCDFDTASRSLGVFDPFTFWRLVGEEKAFSAVGHWGSDRTPNHYYFRIVTKPLFTRYTTALALRLRNVLQERGILPQWVRKLVCTEGEESYILSSALAQVLGLSSRDVIKIPREYFKGITGRDVDRELVKRLESAYGAENLRSKNVLIVDQAAHHFRTFSALRSVCEYFDCTVLGFLVFVDRTTSQIPLGEYLSHSHYVALYSWPCPANRDFECACVKSATSS
jgi:hypoxanthine-guanine phosphoribosyltransferase